MSALPPKCAPADLEADAYVVSHGKSGVIGVFKLAEPGSVARGQKVVVQTQRGVEVGTVLGRATLLKSRLFGAVSSGVLLRRITDADASHFANVNALALLIFEFSRAWAARACMSLEVLDVDLFFDCRQAIVQFVGNDLDTEAFAQALEGQFNLTILLENLAEPHTDGRHGCDKPDCGREAGGCSSCGTGCSSCGSSKVDLRDYFNHLRTQMEKRIPLA
jgi:hypothetical protein